MPWDPADVVLSLQALRHRGSGAPRFRDTEAEARDHPPSTSDPRGVTPRYDRGTSRGMIMTDTHPLGTTMVPAGR